MIELLEFIELIENILNKPFGILLIISGLSFLLIAVLFQVTNIRNIAANFAAISLGVILTLMGAILYVYPLPSPPPRKDTITSESSPPVVQEPVETESVPEKPASHPYLHAMTIRDFEFIWKSKDIFTGYSTICYRPVPPAGYKILGHYIRTHHNDADRPDESGIQIFAVRIPGEFDKAGLLAYPTDYEQIWADKQVGGAIWRPIPPVGYRCLGDVATRFYGSPDRKAIVCVKEDLISDGIAGQIIWEYTAGTANSIRICSILAKDSHKGIALNLFQGYSSRWSRGYTSLPVLRKEYLVKQ